MLQLLKINKKLKFPFDKVSMGELKKLDSGVQALAIALAQIVPVQLGSRKCPTVEKGAELLKEFENEQVPKKYNRKLNDGTKSDKMG